MTGRSLRACSCLTTCEAKAPRGAKAKGPRPASRRGPSGLVCSQNSAGMYVWYARFCCSNRSTMVESHPAVLKSDTNCLSLASRRTNSTEVVRGCRQSSTWATPHGECPFGRGGPCNMRINKRSMSPSSLPCACSASVTSSLANGVTPVGIAGGTVGAVGVVGVRRCLGWDSFLSDSFFMNSVVKKEVGLVAGAVGLVGVTGSAGSRGAVAAKTPPKLGTLHSPGRYTRMPVPGSRRLPVSWVGVVALSMAPRRPQMTPQSASVKEQWIGGSMRRRDSRLLTAAC
mmetsp:Transcript_78210/g.138081  ORF Transcript_78210/g.138081 Transcript_78210/m.138081 type:complete len:285 (+) Transcript_78210:514-1368(+)